ncbi:MAG: hypothetical protein GX621_16510, partial [Pirellulaceae bacterium]|nr:hypothetical protein [Pirellulaceae bacterium]
MSRRSTLLPLLLVCVAMALAGGCTPQQPFYLGDDGDLSHYKGVATQMEVPDVDVRPLDEVCGATTPLTLASPGDMQMWDLCLEEAVHHALANSKVMRNLGVSLQAPESLTRAADGVATVYDPARVESNPRFGVEAALAAFDAQFTTNVFWEKINRPMNVAGVGTLFMARVDQQELGTFQSQLAKRNATGGVTALSYNAYYNNSNSPTREFPSDWNTDVTA